MDAIHREEIRRNLDLRETEDLLEIWQENDLEEWDAEVFEIVKTILLERLGEVPPQSVYNQVEQILDRAERYLDAGELGNALSECERAIQMAPDSARAYNDRGVARDEMGQLEMAIADYQEAIRLDPEFDEAWENLKSAEQSFDAEFEQSAAKQHLDRALEYAYDDEPEKALEECELARPGLPAIAGVHNYFGMVLEELEEVEPAIDAYLEAIRLDPRFYPARVNLANARLRLEQEQYRQAAIQDSEVPQEEGKDSWSADALEDETDPDELQEIEMSEDDHFAPGWLYLDEKAFLLTGWPGHRTRPGRSGYDPLDSDFELAHVEGVVIHRLLARRFRTYNPLYLFVMTCFGLVLGSVLLFGLAAASQSPLASIFLVVFYSPYWIAGAVLLLNVLLSLFTTAPDEDEENGNAFF